MIGTRTLIIISAFWAVVALAGSRRSADTIDGKHTLVPLTWHDVPVWPGKPGVEFEGTLNQVKEQALALNPNWESEIGPDQLGGGFSPASRRHADAGERDLEKRDHSVCNSFLYPWCIVDDAIKAIDMIRYFGFVEVSLPPGPAFCGAIWCTREVQILVCNDNTHEFRTNQGNIANAAAVIIYDCKEDYAGNEIVAGQRFHDANWNVIVRGLEWGSNEPLYC